MKVTETLQVFPADNGFMHFLLTVNGSAVVSSVIITSTFEVFFIVSFFVFFLPTLVLPKSTGFGLNESVPTLGVGVEVGVAVAVAVAVRVGVAVAVMLPVAV